jgi:chromosome segregation ATPase
MQKILALCTLLTLAGAIKTRREDWHDKSLLQEGTLASVMMWKEKPITKVVNLLKDMQAQLESEAAKDEEMYEQMGCWCTTYDKEKTESIAAAQKTIEELTASIEEGEAKSSKLEIEIATLEKELAKSQAALKEAGAIRIKEAGEFGDTQRETMGSIEQMKGAINTLASNHGGAAMVQQTVDTLRKIIRGQSKKHPELIQLSKSSPDTKKIIANMLQQEGPFAGDAAPQSGAIFGILKQMKEEFETNLASAEANEKTANEAYDQLKASKDKEIKALGDQVESKTVELAKSNQGVANDKESLDDTEDALAADQEFLADLKKRCANFDEEFAARKKLRTEEITAVSETIAILTDEEAQDTFVKGQASMDFIQTKMVKYDARQKASKILLAAAQKARNPRLTALAQMSKIDFFSKVKAKIDTMVEALKQESKDEITDRDQCIAELNENEKLTAEKTDTRTDLTAKIADLKAQIETLTSDIAAASKAITDTQIGMKKASVMREAENKEYAVVAQDQQATRAILDKAVARLSQFYRKQQMTGTVKSLVQTDSEQAPPGGFGSMEKNAGGGGALAMIEDIIAESKKVEMEAFQCETSSQAAYEGFIKDSNKSINALTKEISDKTEMKASAALDLQSSDESLKATVQELLGLAEIAQTIHNNCDFLLKNFEERQSKRSMEIDALNQAKAIFSGAGR